MVFSIDPKQDTNLQHQHLMQTAFSFVQWSVDSIMQIMHLTL